MPDKLDVLIIEDAEDDADLLARELKRGGYQLHYQRVDTPEDLSAALDAQGWDLILSDYTMPRFSGTQALALVRAHNSEVPFIFVSGTLGEDTAVTALKAGAQDYLIKGKTGRLLPAVARELRDAQARREYLRMEEERRAAEERYRQVLMIAVDGIVVTDAKSNIAIFNRGAEVIFGYGTDAVIGRSLDLLWPPRLVETNRDRIAAVLAAPHEAASPENREFVALRANGEEFPVEITVSALPDQEGSAVTMIVRDIAERKRAEKKLRQLSRAVEQSANLVIIADARGIIEYVNPRFLDATGYSASEIIGGEPFFWKGPQGNPLNAQAWSAVLSGQDWRGEFENLRKDGTSIAVSATISPVSNDNGAITHVIAIEEDITRRKEIEAQLRQAQKMEAVGLLTGGIAHDFNNLLAIIIGNLDLLTGRLKGDAETHAGIELALAASLRGADLTRQLLAFARQQPLSPRTFDMNRLVDNIVAMLRRILGEKIDIRTQLMPGIWPVEADPTQVETAVANLAINSRDAMPDGGALTIATGNRHFEPATIAPGVDIVPGDYVVLSVTDTGTGIAPEDLKRVCEPFFTTKAPGKGTGLGLSMVYGFAKQSGGHLRIESVVGSGTIVTLYLPRSKSEEAEAFAEVEAATAIRQRSATILVVEDNPHVQDVVIRQLVDLGYEVKAVDDALAALTALREFPDIDLLFSDIVLPGGITGAALVREARKLRPGLRVLLTSGFANAASQDDMVDQDVEFIGKPYRRAELAKKIQTVLDAAA